VKYEFCKIEEKLLEAKEKIRELEKELSSTN
jgi:hypothetical protein